jgi:hypothetical protein
MGEVATELMAIMQSPIRSNDFSVRPDLVLLRFLDGTSADLLHFDSIRAIFICQQTKE